MELLVWQENWFRLSIDMLELKINGLAAYFLLYDNVSQKYSVNNPKFIYFMFLLLQSGKAKKKERTGNVRI